MAEQPPASHPFDRARRLLRDVTPPVEEEPAPPWPATLIGATSGIGFRSPDAGELVRVGVYELPGWDRHDQARLVLERQAVDGDDAQVQTMSATNGDLFLFGTVRLDGPTGRRARFALADIVSAFSGRE